MVVALRELWDQNQPLTHGGSSYSERHLEWIYQLNERHPVTEPRSVKLHLGAGEDVSRNMSRTAVSLKRC